jgi:hypothetical protein
MSNFSWKLIQKIKYIKRLQRRFPQEQRDDGLQENDYRRIALRCNSLGFNPCRGVSEYFYRLI